MAKVAAKAKDRPVKKKQTVGMKICSRFHCTDELLQEQCGNQPCNL